MDRIRRVIETTSEQETIDCGREIALFLKPQMIVALKGDLGAGKTTLIKGIAQQLTGHPIEEVLSPTYSYLNIYHGSCPLYHFDLYRLADSEAFLSLGFEEFFCAAGVCCIEWSQRITEILPPNHVRVHLEQIDLSQRKISYEIPKCKIY